MAETPIFSAGIAIPFTADNRGGVAVIEGDAYISQLIRTLAANSDSENPFLDVGIGIETIFANLSDGAWRAQARRQIEKVFATLERAQIARLLSVRVVDNEDPTKPEEPAAVVRYVSIETETEHLESIPLSRI